MVGSHNNILDCAGRALDLSQPCVMGIVNVTPDSFFDGNRYLQLDTAMRHAEQMVADGAAIIDVGGESTRPGANDVALQEELDRVIPVIEQLTERLDVPVSCDTSKPEVMTAAVSAGAGMINDVFALRQDGALEIAAASGVPVCLMHMRGQPRTMQDAPVYSDVVAEVTDFFQQQLDRCAAAGLASDRILLDPGFGFGKRLEDNLQLLQHLPTFVALGRPVVAGLSRKTMIGQITGLPVDRRLHGSVAAAVLAAARGASLLRVHDVAATVEALSVWSALECNNC